MYPSQRKSQQRCFNKTSSSTIARMLRHGLNLLRKVLTKRAREAHPFEIHNYIDKLKRFYSYPEKLVFVDESSKNGRNASRRYAWSTVNTQVIVSIPFERGFRLSVLASFGSKGFLDWTFTDGTYTRHSFHHAITHVILPRLNPYPMPNSILILDNAKFHLCK